MSKAFGRTNQLPRGSSNNGGSYVQPRYRTPKHHPGKVSSSERGLSDTQKEELSKSSMATLTPEDKRALDRLAFWYEEQQKK